MILYDAQVDLRVETEPGHLRRDLFTLTGMEAEKENAKATKAQIDELLSWAECFEKADIGTKHLIVARLVERIDVSTGYKVHIKFRISLKQFLGQE